MAIGRDIIGNLAEQFGYSKELVREALSSNQIDPLTASLIGSRIDKLQQSKQEAASRTTVMEDVLAPKPEEVMGQGIAGVPQEAPSALAALPSNLPAQEMAGGGIVAFADGGELDLDDDEDEVREKSTLSQLMSGLSSGLASLRRAVPESRGISIPKSYEGALAEKGQTPATVRKMMIEGPKKGDYVMPPIETSGTPKRGGHKYEADVVREAERIGLDPNLAVHVLYKETGNLKNPETARSRAGALGVMQLMPKTAKGLGVDPMNPEENIRGGVTYLKQMMDQFNDPTLALAAYNAGPGRVNQILRSGRGIEALPRETQNYVRMADGGIVAFQAGGLGGEFGGSGEEEERVLIDPYSVRDPMTGEVVPSGYRKTVRKSEAPAEAIIKKEPPKPESSPAAASDVAPAPEISKEQIEKLIGGAQGGEKEDGMMKRYMALLEGREKSSADQRKQDAYLSLLSAGLGMLGGTSPYAAVNIGQGAQAGIAAQAAARKAQAAEEAATLKGFGTAAAAEEYAKQRQLVAAQNRDTKLGNLIANREKQLESLALGTVTKIGLNTDSAEGQARLAKEIQRLKSTDTLLPKLYQEYGLPPVQAAAPAKPLTADELIAQKKAERKRLGLE